MQITEPESRLYINLPLQQSRSPSLPVPAMATFSMLFSVWALLLPALATAHPFQKPYTINGYVYCDTCRCGFETPASTPVSGAIVRLECRDRVNWVVKYTKEGITNSKGKYTISVTEDHRDESCRVALVRSPHANCNEPDIGRDSATVILTDNNGLTHHNRFANAMGFLTKRPLALCPSLLKQYLDFDQPF